MNSKVLHFFAGIFLLATFVQCNDAPLTSEKQQQQELSKPQLLAPADGAQEASSVVLDWKKTQGAESYQIQLSTSEDFTNPFVEGSADSTQFPVEGLPHSESIHWKVRPVAQGEPGPWSDSRMFNTEEAPENPEAISTTLQSPSNGSSDEPVNPKLEWSTVAVATGYNLQIATDENFSNLIIEQDVENNFYEVETLRVEQSFYWRIQPVVEDQTTEWSDTFNFTTSASPVALIAPENGATNQATHVTFEWKEVAGESNYQLQVGTDDTFSSPVVDETVNATSYEASGFTNNRTYFWRVRTASDSKWSSSYSFKTEAAKTTAPAPNQGFVSVSNGDFVLDGEVFRFAGTNAYHLPNYEKIDPSVVNRAMDGFQEAGVEVVRTWGFYDGAPQYNNDITLQPEAGQYSEENLQHLDRMIAKGKEHGVKFILALTNYWHELGGMPQYNAWDGNPDGGMQHFMNDADTQGWFKAYIKMLLERTNTVTGVKYKNEPAIFAWEIMNEGRNPDSSDPQELADWYQEIAQYIKSIDPNHMVSTGEEGFDYGTPDVYSSDEYSNTYVLRAKEGTSYLANTSVPEIDYGTAHWYPSRWISRDNETDIITSQRAFMGDHAKIAEDLGKPFVIGEYGFEGNANAMQVRIYEDLWNFNQQNKIDGSLIWQLTADYVKCWEYMGNICYPGGREDTEMYNSFKYHIDAMRTSR